MVALLANTAAAAVAQIKAAAPGDIVLLADGDYSLINVADVTKEAPGITIKPAQGAKPVLRGVKLSRVAGLAFRDFTIRPAQKYAIEWRSVERCSLTHCDVGGPVVEQTGFNDVLQGVLVKYGKQVAFRGNDFHDMRIAIGYSVCDGVVISGNQLHDLAGDAIRGSGRNILIQGNAGWDLFQWNDDHIDFIQFSSVDQWNEGITPAHIRVLDNDYRRGAGHQAQGIFLRGSADLRFQDVTIARNGMVGTNFNGIYATFVDGLRVTDNFVQGDDASNPARILAADSTDVTLARNVTSYPRLLNGRNTGETVEANTLSAPVAATGDYSDLDAWRLASR